MQSAKTVLGILQQRGKQGLPLTQLYRQLFNRDLYLLAYAKIYRNKGALTPGPTAETADAMSLAKIDALIEALRYERYRWQPVRRTYIEKKNSKKKRPLGLPSWSDKLLQEVIRLLLEAYYEPQFSNYSHGFRPGRGCHTALTEIYKTWIGTKWFIEGDIAQCFDSLAPEVLLGILAEKIKDNRFLRLIENLLRAGYLENWQHKTTLSGVPQGSTVGPILSNLYLDRLDKWVETELLPLYNRGEQRHYNPPYLKLMNRSRYWKRKGQKELGLRLRRQAQSLPSLDPTDANYRRLRYLRYADDVLIGFVGPRQEAAEIKARLGEFLQSLKLELSQAKTLLTHARSGAAKFLGYEVVILNDNHKHDWRDHRSINGQVGLKVPKEVIRAKQQLYLERGKPKRRGGLSYNTAFSIITQYQQEFRGLVQYYQLAFNLHQFNTLKWQMERSLVLTLADKFKLTMSKVYQRYQTVVQTEHGPRKVLQVKVAREEGKPPLVAQWGGIRLARNVKAILDEQPHIALNDRSELIQRLLADKCELCGSQEDVEIHHIRGMRDLKRKGQSPRPRWVEVMAARQRKTLVVCRKCHDQIHHGKWSNPLQLA